MAVAIRRRASAMPNNFTTTASEKGSETTACRKSLNRGRVTTRISTSDNPRAISAFRSVPTPLRATAFLLWFRTIITFLG